VSLQSSDSRHVKANSFIIIIIIIGTKIDALVDPEMTFGQVISGSSKASILVPIESAYSISY